MKTLVTFKKWGREGVHEKPIYRGEWPKKEELGKFAD